MRLSVHMRDALTAASRQDGLRRIHDNQPGKPSWPAPPQTLHALVRHGLLECSQVRNRKGWLTDVWRVTAAGREALEPKLPRAKADRPEYLRWTGRGSDYTSDVSQASDDAEIVDSAKIEGLPSSREAQQRWIMDRREREASYLGLSIVEKAQLAQALLKDGRDVSNPLKQAERQLDRALKRAFDKAA